MRIPAEERRILLILAAIEFLSFLDFEYMMPLGAFMGSDLKLDASQLGNLVGAYTFAGMGGALLYSRYADRWEKRASLCWLMAGLALGTFACALAHGYGQLLASRLLAGFMSGPAGAAVLAIVSDTVPEERRGQGMAMVFNSLTAAEVLGVPLAVFFADTWGWRPPFVGLAGLAAVVIPIAFFALPKFPAKPETPDTKTAQRPLLAQPLVLLAWATMAVLMTADFAFVPFLPSFLTQNLGLPKSALGIAYAAGGLTTFVTFPLAGRLTDRFGAFWIHALGSVGIMAVVFALFLSAPNPIGLWLGAAALAAIFFTNAPRVLSAMTLMTKVPAPEQRGAFMALQNVVQLGAVSFGTFAAARLIRGGVDGKIGHVGRLVGQNWIAVALGVGMVWVLERNMARPGGSRALSGAETAGNISPELAETKP